MVPRLQADILRLQMAAQTAYRRANETTDRVDRQAWSDLGRHLELKADQLSTILDSLD